MVLFSLVVLLPQLLLMVTLDNNLDGTLNVYDGIQWRVPQSDITGVVTLTANTPLIQTELQQIRSSVTSSSTSNEGTIRPQTQLKSTLHQSPPL